MEVAADENEAPHGVRWLAEVLAKRERHKMVSRCGAAAKSIKQLQYYSADFNGSVQSEGAQQVR